MRGQGKETTHPGGQARPERSQGGPGASRALSDLRSGSAMPLSRRECGKR